jgi:small-conductance mechanosensitive channel
MDQITGIIESVRPFFPALLVAFAAVVIILAVRHTLDRIRGKRAEAQYSRQLLTIAVTLASVFALLLVLPLGDTVRGQLLGFVGIVLSATLALSSTTLMGNALAGLMLRAIRNFRPGDFITIGDHFGRVSERGLFHTEIQTEDRDLTTLPNMYLVSHPVRVMRSSGTLLSASVSLGYDVPRTRAEAALLEAAQNAGLADPFVSVLDLGDFSVHYRIAGMLSEVKEILSTRSRLRAMMLDSLHRAAIEIVSPSFMNARWVKDTDPIIPPASAIPATTTAAQPSKPESLVFDKADRAESIENLKKSLADLDESIGAIEKETKEATGPNKDSGRAQIETLKARRDSLAEVIKQRESSLDS